MHFWCSVETIISFLLPKVIPWIHSFHFFFDWIVDSDIPELVQAKFVGKWCSHADGFYTLSLRHCKSVHNENDALLCFKHLNPIYFSHKYIEAWACPACACAMVESWVSDPLTQDATVLDLFFFFHQHLHLKLGKKCCIALVFFHCSLTPHSDIHLS
jgi:hypothetical protein